MKAETLAAHKMHNEERFEIGEETVRVVNESKKSGNRIIAAGTTTVRARWKASPCKIREKSMLAGVKPVFLYIRRVHSKSWTHC